VAKAALDDVFSDDITVPAADGYAIAATLFLPRGAKRHAILINSATAVPRKIYRGFAGYLARRGFAALTYDYRGIGGSRLRALEGYDQPRSLVGFKATMADWAALDATAMVGWMRERYRKLPLTYLGHSFGGQVLGLLGNNNEVSRALLVAAQAGYWKLMTSPERYRVFAMLNFVGTPLDPSARLRAGLERTRRRPAAGRVLAMGALGEQPALSLRRQDACRSLELSRIQGRFARDLSLGRSLGDSTGGRAVVLGLHVDQTGDPHRHAAGRRCHETRPFRLLPARAPRHAVARRRRMA